MGKIYISEADEAEKLRVEVQHLNNTNGQMTNRWKAVNMFPESFIQLNRETAEHPILMERLANHPSAEWEVKLAEIANYVGLVLDGQYMPEDIENICNILYKKLLLKRPSQEGKILVVGNRY